MRPHRIAGISTVAKGFKTLRVYKAHHMGDSFDSAAKSVLHVYKFDEEGRQTSHLYNFVAGMPQRATVYARRANGKVARKIDLKVNPNKPFLQYADTTAVTAYVYDQNDHLRRIQPIDRETMRFLPDSLASYESFAYDAQGQLSAHTVQSYYQFSGTKSVKNYRYEYADNRRYMLLEQPGVSYPIASESVDAANIVEYDPDGLPKRRTNGWGDVYQEYTYDTQGRLLSVHVNPDEHYRLSCSGKAGFVCEFVYGEHGLPSRLRHILNDQVCELRLEYE